MIVGSNVPFLFRGLQVKVNGWIFNPVLIRALHSTSLLKPKYIWKIIYYYFYMYISAFWVYLNSLGKISPHNSQEIPRYICELLGDLKITERQEQITPNSQLLRLQKTDWGSGWGEQSVTIGSAWGWLLEQPQDWFCTRHVHINIW